ncbi:MAG TPA: hypothetical protein VHS09_02040 [Polyangiaceae bacterium]|jgi:hypothetical protein|nr:hypothetical protein [Polyangiaceae bacterium]
MSSYITTEAQAQKRFAAEDKAWRAPRFFALGLVTLAIALTAIYLMSTTSGCSLQIVP